VAEEEEAKVGMVERIELREEDWWYLLRYPDGTTEWVREDRLERAEG